MRLKLLLIAIVPAFAFSETRFTSPKGTHEIGFEVQERQMYSNPYARPLPPGTKTRIYRVSFYKPKSTFPDVQTYYTDIQQGPSSDFPVPPAKLAQQILWSPEGTFAVMPIEHWPEDKNRPLYRQAVALKSDLSWQTADFRLNDNPLIWTSATEVIGNASTACQDYVAAFDGRTGKSRVIEAGSDSTGYRIVSSSPEQIVMEETPSSCEPHSPSQRKNVCMILDLRFNRRQISPCPR